MKIVNEQIEVIAAFMRDEVKPLRFRRIINVNEYEVHRIIKVLKTDMKPGFYYQKAASFTCLIENDKICEILYDFDHGKWILLKI